MRVRRLPLVTGVALCLLVAGCPTLTQPLGELISEFDYQTTCSNDADCVVVNAGYAEELCNNDCKVNWHMSISRSSLSEYETDLGNIDCRVPLTLEKCADPNSTPFCNNSGKCDR